MTQAEHVDQGFWRHFQNCRAYLNLDRLDRLPAPNLAQFQKKSGLGPFGVHPPGPDHAP